MTTTDSLKVGILSFAHQHANGYAECLRGLPGVELAAIADDDPERGRRAASEFGADYHQDYLELLARPEIAAVVVCSANAHHREMTVAAAAARKHVLCEKPLATTRPDALAMIEACREQGVMLGTAFPMRFSPPVLALREALAAGAVGTPLAVMATNPGTVQSGWFVDPQLAGGGATIDHTVHVADLLRWLFGREIVRVYAEIDTRLSPGLPVDDVGVLMLDLEGGLPVSLDASWEKPKSWPIWGGVTMDVIGDRGVIAMDAFRQNLQRFDNRGRQYRLVPWAEGGDPGLIAAFVEAVRTGTSFPVTGEDGLKALEVALCAYESARRREPVTCPNALL
jgi:predicted dehydrogenase